MNMPDFDTGTVWLVGAGPGDPGLLTLLALHGLRHCDHVVHDSLVDPRILDLANPAAILESMGKRGGQPSPRQTQINDRLIALARQGKRVVRLKGGDPFVFGRGADEALALVEAGIAFRVVPGISAGIGGLAYAGIPVTAGQCNTSVAFITGHGADGTLPDPLDWTGLGTGAGSLVFYMAMGQIGPITHHLMAAGRDGAEPAAIVSQAATPRQQVLISTLASITADLAQTPLPAPALLVVGPVAGLARSLDWWRPG